MGIKLYPHQVDAQKNEKWMYSLRRGWFWKKYYPFPLHIIIFNKVGTQTL